jgi:hypothetical protein
MYLVGGEASLPPPPTKLNITNKERRKVGG